MSSIPLVISNLTETAQNKYIVRSVLTTTLEATEDQEELQRLKDILRSKSVQNMACLLEIHGMIKYHFQKPIGKDDMVQLISSISISK